MTRQQLEDAVQCGGHEENCKYCTAAKRYNGRYCTQRAADEALRQKERADEAQAEVGKLREKMGVMENDAVNAEINLQRETERAERWKAVAEQALKSLNVYNDGDGDVRICVIDEQAKVALDAYEAAAKEDEG